MITEEAYQEVNDLNNVHHSSASIQHFINGTFFFASFSTKRRRTYGKENMYPSIPAAIPITPDFPSIV